MPDTKSKANLKKLNDRGGTTPSSKAKRWPVVAVRRASSDGGTSSSSSSSPSVIDEIKSELNRHNKAMVDHVRDLEKQVEAAKTKLRSFEAELRARDQEKAKIERKALGYVEQQRQEMLLRLKDVRKCVLLLCVPTENVLTLVVYVALQLMGKAYNAIVDGGCAKDVVKHILQQVYVHTEAGLGGVTESDEEVEVEEDDDHSNGRGSRRGRFGSTASAFAAARAKFGRRG